MSLGENLKKIRKKWRLNQSSFGELLGASQYDISSYENGKYEPKISTMIKLEKLVGISVRQLYEGQIEESRLPLLPIQDNKSDNFHDDEVERSSTWDNPELGISSPAFSKKEGELSSDMVQLIAVVQALQKEVELMRKKMERVEEEVVRLKNITT